MKALTLATALLAGFAGGTVADILTMVNPVFSAGFTPRGQLQIWEFRNQSDNSVARVIVNAEGAHEGAVPDGWAELLLRAQAEVHGAQGQALASDDMQGGLRIMSRSFKYTTDPMHGGCDGNQCAETLEMFSNRHIRLSTGNTGAFDVVANNRVVFAINRLGGNEIELPMLTGETLAYLCIDDKGMLLRCAR